MSACSSGDGRGLPAGQRLDLATGQRRPWKQLMPAGASGMTAIGNIALTPDGSFIRNLAGLYVVEGLSRSG